MSIMRMRRKFAQHLKIILWVILAVFVIGIPFIYFGAGSLRSPGQAVQEKAPEEVVATVAGQKILRSRLDEAFHVALAQQAGSNPSFLGQRGVPLNALLGLRYNALMGLAANMLLEQEARAKGFSAGKADIDKRAEQEADNLVQQLQQQAATSRRDPRELYREFMASRGAQRSRISEGEFRDWVRDFVLQNGKEDLQRIVLLGQLRASVVAPVRVSDADLLANYDQAKAEVIFLPLSGPQAEAAAQKQAQEIYSRLQGRANFATLAKAHPGPSPTAATEWQSRPLLRAIYGEAGERAVFALAPGKFSAPVRTPSGYAIFLLQETRRQLSPNFAKEKEQAKTGLLAQRQSEAWDKFTQAVIEKVKITPKTPEIAALKAFAEQKPAQGIAELQKTMQDPQALLPEVYAAVSVQLASNYSEKKDWKKARESLENALSPPGDFPQGAVQGYPEEIYLALGKLSLQEKKKADALEYFQQAAGAPDNYMVHVSLLEIYQKIGDKDKAAEEQKWLAEYGQEQQRALKEMQAQQQRAQAPSQTGSKKSPWKSPAQEAPAP